MEGSKQKLTVKALKWALKCGQQQWWNGDVMLGKTLQETEDVVVAVAVMCQHCLLTTWRYQNKRLSALRATRHTEGKNSYQTASAPHPESKQLLVGRQHQRQQRCCFLSTFFCRTCMYECIYMYRCVSLPNNLHLFKHLLSYVDPC